MTTKPTFLLLVFLALASGFLMAPTPRPPTLTPVPTDTPEPTATNTPEPPTATPEPTVTPTNTPAPTATADPTATPFASILTAPLSSATVAVAPTQPVTVVPPTVPPTQPAPVAAPEPVVAFLLPETGGTSSCVKIVLALLAVALVGYVIYRVLEVSARANDEAEAMERQLITDRLARTSEDKTR